jgi:hypothetical protein
MFIREYREEPTGSTQWNKEEFRVTWRRREIWGFWRWVHLRFTQKQ